MPEGHLIHHYAREHADALAGAPVATSSPQGRFAAEAAMLTGSTLVAVEAFGKHLFYRWDEPHIVHVHLGMRGLFLRHPTPPPEPRGQVRLRLEGARATIDLIAPVACELVDEQAMQAIVAQLGPDPLRDPAFPRAAAERIRASSRPIGELLLDQSVLAGLGNVLRAEVLNITGVHPARAGRSLSADEMDEIWKTTVHVMQDAREYGRIVTRLPEGEDPISIPEREARFVYKQQACRRCGTPVETFELGRRTAYACPRCQPVAAA